MPRGGLSPGDSIQLSALASISCLQPLCPCLGPLPSRLASTNPQQRASKPPYPNRFSRRLPLAGIARLVGGIAQQCQPSLQAVRIGASVRRHKSEMFRLSQKICRWTPSCGSQLWNNDKEAREIGSQPARHPQKVVRGGPAVAPGGGSPAAGDHA